MTNIHTPGPAASTRVIDLSEADLDLVLSSLRREHNHLAATVSRYEKTRSKTRNAAALAMADEGVDQSRRRMKAIDAVIVKLLPPLVGEARAKRVDP